jgi:hypothetical protein
VLDCCAAITEGVAHGVVSLANPIIHPIETVENFKRLVEIAGCCVGKVTKLLWSSFITHDVETATRITQEFDAIYNALVTYVKEHPREAIKQGTSFITQTILMNYGTHALHSFFKQAMVELPEYINLLPETAAAVEVQAATLTAAIATHGARVAVNTTKMGEDFLALSKIISGMGPYIPLGQHLPHLEKIYKDSVKGFADKPNVYVEFRDGVLHVFEPGIKLTKTKAKVDGFHHDYLNHLENTGQVQLVNKIMYEGGFYKADVFYKGAFSQEKTFFPADWPREKVLRTLIDFIKKNSDKAIQEGSRWKIEASLFDNIKLRVIIENTMKFITGFLLLGKK